MKFMAGSRMALIIAVRRLDLNVNFQYAEIDEVTALLPLPKGVPWF